MFCLNKNMFSTSKKSRIVATYPTEYLELVRAHLYESQERINNLVVNWTAVDDETRRSYMKISDADTLVTMAQDYVATQKLLTPSLNNQNLETLFNQ